MRFSEAEVVLACDSLTETIDFFENRLGFQLTRIFPADAPMSAILQGYGLQIRLQRGGTGSPGSLCLYVKDPTLFSRAQEVLVAPNGTRIEIVSGKEQHNRSFPPPAFSLCLSADHSAWGEGRAGMEYRDLIPDRQGGFLIGSHIRVLDGGLVPDYVHCHQVDFQLIYCYRGWVRVVYEGQGESFLMEQGDFILQPPLIRHRVLEASQGLEVIEIASPAKHETLVASNFVLPNFNLPSTRLFSGQEFLRHAAKDRKWEASQLEGFGSCDVGVAKASGGVADVFIVRRDRGGVDDFVYRQNYGLSFFFVLQAGMILQTEDHADVLLKQSDCFVMPSGQEFSFKSSDDNLELLQVIMPGQARIATNHS